MAVLYWLGNTAGDSGGDWNTAENWVTPQIIGGTGGNAHSTQLIPSGRSPWAGDSVYINNVLPYPVQGYSTVNLAPIMANCVTGGMSVVGTTYYWVSAGSTSGLTATGPLFNLNVGVIGYPAQDYAYSKFSFNSDVSMPLFWQYSSLELVDDTWMLTNPEYWTVGYKGIVNGGYTASSYNQISSVVSYNINSTAKFSKHRWNVTLSGKIGKWTTPDFVTSTATQPDGYGYWFGDITVAAATTINTFEIKGQPGSVYFPLGSTCDNMSINLLNHTVGITTAIIINCTVGSTTNDRSASSANNYQNFKGIKFNKTQPPSTSAASYKIYIGNPVGTTGSSLSTTPLYYNLWEDNSSNVAGGEADIVIQGACFINDMLLEDSRMSILSNSNTQDTIIIKSATLRGQSSLDLRRSSTGFYGLTASVPLILGGSALAYGWTGAAGLKIESSTCTFIPHPNSTISG